MIEKAYVARCDKCKYSQTVIETSREEAKGRLRRDGWLIVGWKTAQERHLCPVCRKQYKPAGEMI